MTNTTKLWLLLLVQAVLTAGLFAVVLWLIFSFTDVTGGQLAVAFLIVVLSTIAYLVVYEKRRKQD
jgi:anti-sigma-K factor RskA